MKAFISILASIFVLSFASCAGERISDNPSKEGSTVVIPDAAKNNFQSNHPNINDVEWEKEGDYVEATFQENGLQGSVLYDARCNEVETERQIAASTLLPAIMEYINRKYVGCKIKEAEKIENSEGTFYKVDLECNGQEHEVKFDAKGSFVEQVIESDNDEDDDDGD